MTEQEAYELCITDPKTAARNIVQVEQLQAVVISQAAHIEKLEARIKELEERLGLNSQNSSKPPSSDNTFTKSKKESPSPKRSTRKRGGQKGHTGNTLKQTDHPDRIVSLSASCCNHCQHPLHEEDTIEVQKRQVFDIQITMESTEYRAPTYRCPVCHQTTKPSFPEHVKARAQYGKSLQALVAYLSTYQMLPYERITQMIEDMTGHRIATGTLYAILKRCHQSLKPFENSLKEALSHQKVLHGDETGLNVQSVLHWVHVLSSSKFSFFLPHAKRGKEAMDTMAVLPTFTGILMHDHWSSYHRFEQITHVFCNAHILRELQYVIDFEKAEWAERLQHLFQDMIVAKKHANGHLSPQQIEQFVQTYESILQDAYQYYPPPDRKAKRGRIKQPKGKNLLDRLSKYQEGHLLFLHDPDVPFTNNQAERDLRMIKVKEKISGCFASMEGAQVFCRIRSYISTLKKNDMPLLQGLANALMGDCFMPVGVGC